MGISSMESVQCDFEECPHFDGKRCKTLGTQPSYICQPLAELLFELHGPSAENARKDLLWALSRIRDTVNEVI